MERIILIFLLSGAGDFLTSQNLAEWEYDLLLNEVQILQYYTPIDEALLDSAQLYHNQGEFEIAGVFLETILLESGDVLPQDNASFNNEEDNKALRNPMQFRIRSGVDYNHQEFEIEYAEDDSLLVDEVQKPFIGMEMQYFLLDNSSANDLSLFSKVRSDKENLKGDIGVDYALQTNTLSASSRLGYMMDKNDLFKDLSYHEAYFNSDLNWDLSRGWNFRMNNLLRFKQYKSPSTTVPDFVKEIANFELGYFTGMRRLTCDYEINFNESQDTQNNDFLEQTGWMNIKGLFGSRFRNDLGLGYRNNLFSHEYSDSVTQNRSQTISTDNTFYKNLSSKWSMGLEYSFDYKWYNEKTEQDPDYVLHYLQSELVYDFNIKWSVKTGYIYEHKIHASDPDLIRTYIEEQDYRGNGLSLGIDLSTMAGSMLSFQGSYTWRRYPHASADNSLSLYSNRNILNFFLFLQMPILQNLNLNILASYDNDKDKDNDRNDARSSFFTAEFEYNF